MTLARTDYQGNVNIGLYGLTTEAQTFLAPGFAQDVFADAADVRVAETPLVGLFAAGNANGLLVPDIATDREVTALEDAGASVHVLEHRHTALGNLVLCNGTGALVSPALDEVTDTITDALGVDVETGTVAGLEIPGSCGVATDSGVLLHRDASEEELAAAEDVLDVEGDIGSVNFGTPYVHSGILATTQHLLVGNDTKGPELQRIQDALGFLD